MTALTVSLATLAIVACVAAVAAGVALVGLRRAKAAAEREAADLRARLDALEARLHPPADAGVVRAEHEYVITHLGEVGDDVPGGARRAPAAVTLAPPAFADAVLRETVVQAASLVHGLRRALAPETRNRIRFEMRRELKRTRRARKAEVREAVRQYRAQQRAEGAA